METILPTDQRVIQAFRDARFGLMLHYGLYSMLGGIYRGQRGPGYAEWIQAYHRIPRAEMHALARTFSPDCFDADTICELAAAAGMRYVVLTAKHHEGFALFRTKTDFFSSADRSSCGRDLVGELADACARRNLRLGLYYSQVIDWNEEDGGGYGADPAGAAGPSWENSWDFPDKRSKDYARCFERKILPQIRELLTGYGPLFTFWFDMPLDSSPQQSERIYREVKRLQPDCLVNSRLGNGCYDYVSLGDNEIPEALTAADAAEDGGKQRENGAVACLNRIEGLKPSPYGLYESACTMNHSWGYCSWDEDWKTADCIRNTQAKLERLGVNYLLNAGPQGNGQIPEAAAGLLRELSR